MQKNWDRQKGGTVLSFSQSPMAKMKRAQTRQETETELRSVLFFSSDRRSCYCILCYKIRSYGIRLLTWSSSLICSYSSQSKPCQSLRNRSFPFLTSLRSQLGDMVLKERSYPLLALSLSSLILYLDFSNLALESVSVLGEILSIFPRGRKTVANEIP